MEKPSLHPSLGGRGLSLYLLPTAPRHLCVQIFPSECLHTRSGPVVSAQFLSSRDLVGGGCLSERRVFAWGSRGLFLKLYLPSFYPIKRTCHLTTKELGDTDENYLDPQSLLLLATAPASYSLSPPPPSQDLGVHPWGAEAGGRVETCL